MLSCPTFWWILFASCAVSSAVAQRPDETSRCRCICPDTNTVPGLNSTGQRFYTDSQPQTNSSECSRVIVVQYLMDRMLPDASVGNLTTEKEKTMEGKIKQFAEKCKCKHENRNVLMIKWVVFFVIFVMLLLVAYMLYLVCLDPVFKRSGISYEQQRDEIGDNIFEPVDTQFPSGALDGSQPDSPAAVVSGIRSRSSGGVLDRVEAEQNRWRQKVQAQRKNIFTDHTMLN